MPFDPAFFMHYEDHDFGLRVRSLGHQILSVPSAFCYHREGTAGLSLRPGKPYPKARVYFLIRNRWQVILKHYTGKTLLLLFPILVIYELFQLGGIIKKRWFREWGRAALWTVLHFAHILRQRRTVQKTRKVPDRVLLCGGPIPFTPDLARSPLERKAKNLLDRLATFYWKLIQQWI